LREAGKLGFRRALVPRTAGGRLPRDMGGIEALPVATLRDAARHLGL
jgi:hypothetical protein